MSRHLKWRHHNHSNNSGNFSRKNNNSDSNSNWTTESAEALRIPLPPSPALLTKCRFHPSMRTALAAKAEPKNEGETPVVGDATAMQRVKTPTTNTDSLNCLERWVGFPATWRCSIRFDLKKKGGEVHEDETLCRFCFWKKIDRRQVKSKKSDGFSKWGRGCFPRRDGGSAVPVESRRAGRAGGWTFFQPKKNE